MRRNPGIGATAARRGAHGGRREGGCGWVRHGRASGRRRFRSYRRQRSRGGGRRGRRRRGDAPSSGPVRRSTVRIPTYTYALVEYSPLLNIGLVLFLTVIPNTQRPLEPAQRFDAAAVVVAQSSYSRVLRSLAAGRRRRRRRDDGSRQEGSGREDAVAHSEGFGFRVEAAAAPRCFITRLSV